MKDIVQDRLARIEDLEQRKLLKSILTGVFLNLVEYQEDLNRKLEERVFMEMEAREDHHDIYVTVCPKEEMDPIHEYLFPVIPEDAERKPCELKGLLAQARRHEEPVLMTVFLQCEYSKLRTLLDGRRRFTGEAVTANGRHAVTVSLRPNRAYLNELERLYTVFQKNNMPWKTVNFPYAHKFFDVIWTSCEDTLRDDEEIAEIRFHLEEFDPFKKLHMVPMWNIERLELKNVGFPIPAVDKVNFEHVLSLRKTGTEHGYLVDGEEEAIRYIKRSPEELTIVSPQEKAGIWSVLKMTKPVPTKLGRLPYRLVSNKKKNSFTSGFARKQAITVRAQGEIMRIVSSFEASEGLELEQVDIIDRTEGAASTYSMNPFISDNVRVESDKKIMRLRFRRLGGTSFIDQDMMSFLVSEVQMYFPEYKCEGEWA
ncbi:normocyte-binding protein [Paenibacillus rigui]|uniref:Normocyte-binding protein n=1 Tax=Paenibacillus rigui TaxID=554312 RepID=A0A229UPT8_9BACL|nr:normocyte-binding protein [Paenibacillus rigui]OXM85384.1 normocyte-binding protein [Paenibacillus rigui]